MAMDREWQVPVLLILSFCCECLLRTEPVVFVSLISVVGSFGHGFSSTNFLCVVCSWLWELGKWLWSRQRTRECAALGR